MSIYWSKITTELDPYVPGEQPQDKKYIKLNTNENPYPPSPKTLQAMKDAANADLRLYPTPTCDKLRECIARFHGLTKEQVFVGNGSDEVLAMSFMTFFDPGRPILFPDITYSFYPVYAGLFHIYYKLLSLNDDFSIPVEQFLTDNGGVIFPNPNAPTGRYLPLAAIEEIVQKNAKQVVIVDEAYIDFGGQSAAALINKYPNLLVIQTFSKSRSLAGMRIGFALGNKELIEGLERVKNSFNSYTLDRVALAGAIAAFQDKDYFAGSCKRVIATREKTAAALTKLGFTVIPSAANFLFISHSVISAAKLYQLLRDNGILVRYFNKPRIDNFLRVSIGSEEEMDLFIQKTAKIVG
ncbi:MAG: histidinol-phosphate transaminase [Pelosinus sp.]|nr:histidinol-phosphate transaminase [Pelosinus sp.]